MSYNITSKETQPTTWLHLNGTPDQILDRYCVSELINGWPVYRDASEWKNYRQCFADDAYVFTTWSGGLPIDDFISASQKGRAEGDFISHRATGTLVDLSSTTTRAIAKMKTTITQRFHEKDPHNPSRTIEYDVDCDARFIAFCVKRPLSARSSSPMPGTGLGPRSGSAGWRIQFVKLFYEKDRVVPVDGHSVPMFEDHELDQFPYGYRYLGAAQVRRGREIVRDLPTLRDDESFWSLHRAMDGWLNGEDIREVLGIK